MEGKVFTHSPIIEGVGLVYRYYNITCGVYPSPAHSYLPLSFTAHTVFACNDYRNKDEITSAEYYQGQIDQGRID